MDNGNSEEIRAVVTIDKADSITIDFDSRKRYSIESTDFANCNLTGDVPVGMDIDRHNFLRSSIHGLQATGCNFENCDFVDTSLVASTFRQCRMHQTHFNTCTISESEFVECDPTLTNFNNCTFRDVTFRGCDLSRILIKRCKLHNCTFENCTTTNKLFETCIVFGCRFASTTLQVQSVLANFGLRSTDFTNCAFRTARTWESHSVLTLDEIETRFSNGQFSSLDDFRVQFFLGGMDESAYLALDVSLSEVDWLAAARVAGAFVDSLELFSDFLLLLYEQNQVYLLPLLKLNKLLATLAEHLDRIDEGAGIDVYRCVLGSQMIYARLTERFLLLHERFCDEPTKQLEFLGEGPGQVEYFQDALEAMIDVAGVSLNSVRPHNSPVEVVLNVGSIAAYSVVMAMFLATRLSLKIRVLEVAKIDHRGSEPGESSQAAKVATDTVASDKPGDGSPRFLTVDLGRGSTRDTLFALKIRALTPGSILVDLGLDISVKRALSLHKHLLDLLPTRKQES